MIYALGNSHAHFFTNSHPGKLGWGTVKSEIFTSYSGNFLNNKYPHVLAHKFKERFFPHFIPVINSINFTEHDYLMFIVGEIDCRWHFPKKIKTKELNINDVLIEEMEHFFPSLLELKENNYQIIGWGVHPSTTRSHHDPDPDDPIYGDCLFRNEITSKWNMLLEQKCDANKIPFISIMNELLDENGFTKMEYFDDDFHLNQLTMPLVLDKLKNVGILK